MNNDDCRILLAEDDAGNRMVASELIELLGLTVDAVENGNDAFEKYLTGSYRLAVFDIHIRGEMDGVDLIRKIRAHEKEHGLPRMKILCVTASVFTKDRDRCFEAGADDHLTKPYNIDIFQEKIAALYDRPRMDKHVSA